MLKHVPIQIRDDVLHIRKTEQGQMTQTAELCELLSKIEKETGVADSLMAAASNLSTAATIYRERSQKKAADAEQQSSDG